MSFTLPMKDDVIALIDVTRGGETVRQALEALGAETVKSAGCLGCAVVAGNGDDKVLTYAQWASALAFKQWMKDGGARLRSIGENGPWRGRGFRLSFSVSRETIDLTSDCAYREIIKPACELFIARFTLRYPRMTRLLRWKFPLRHC